MKTQLILVAILLGSTLSACTVGVAGCLTCNGDDCATCYNGFFLDTNVCTACAAGCQTCTAATAADCTVCNPGFHTITGCVACGAGCSGCTDATDCFACSNPDQKFNAAGTACEDYPAAADCMTLAADKATCTACNNGKFVKDGMCTETCTVEKCGTCNADQAKCETCMDGYFLASETSCITNEDAQKAASSSFKTITSILSLVGLAIFFRF